MFKLEGVVDSLSESGWQIIDHMGQQVYMKRVLMGPHWCVVTVSSMGELHGEGEGEGEGEAHEGNEEAREEKGQVHEEWELHDEEGGLHEKGELLVGVHGDSEWGLNGKGEPLHERR